MPTKKEDPAASDFLTESLIELLAASKIQQSATDAIKDNVKEIRTDAKEASKKIDDLSASMRAVTVSQSEMQETLKDHAQKIDSGKKKIDHIMGIIERPLEATPPPSSIVPNAGPIEDGPSMIVKFSSGKKVIEAAKHPAVTIPGGVAVYETLKEFVLPVVKALFSHKSGQ